MARALRIQFAGAIYHVMSRASATQDIVRDDADRQKPLDWLRRTLEIYGWRMHWFVLMRNHERLFVGTPEPNLPAGMQYLNSGYASHFNRRHRCCGHLFQGGFQGHLIDQQGYFLFLEVSRYIHLNPVRFDSGFDAEVVHKACRKGRLPLRLFRQGEVHRHPALRGRYITEK